MSTREQHYRNHRNFDPTTYFFLFPLTILLIAAFVMEWVAFGQGNQDIWPTVTMSAMELTVLILAFRMRLYALIAQDRAIRAEEQVRHFALTGKTLNPQLTIQQIVALRFASDEEVVALAQRAVEEKLTSNQIKQAIRNWRADWHRV